MSINATNVSATEGSPALQGVAIRLGSAEALSRSITALIRGEASVIKGRRSVAENFNAGFAHQWWDKTHPEWVKVAPYFKAIQDGLRSIGHSNPSVAWGEIVLYAKQARGIVDAQTEKAAAKAAKQKGKAKAEGNSEGVEVPVTPHQFTLVKLTELQKFLANQAELDDTLKGVLEFVELSLQSLGADMRAELPKAA